MKTTTHYRVITPSSFSDINIVSAGERVNQLINCVDEARTEIDTFGRVSRSSEYYEKWEQRRQECRIVKVTTIIEEL